MSMKKPDAFGRRAQFQLWIFSYTIFGRLAKNKLSRLMIACVAAQLPCVVLRCARFALSTLRRRRDRHSCTFIAMATEV